MKNDLEPHPTRRTAMEFRLEDISKNVHPYISPPVGTQGDSYELVESTLVAGPSGFRSQPYNSSAPLKGVTGTVVKESLGTTVESVTSPLCGQGCNIEGKEGSLTGIRVSGFQTRGM